MSKNECLVVTMPLSSTILMGVVAFFWFGAASQSRPRVFDGMARAVAGTGQAVAA